MRRHCLVLALVLTLLAPLLLRGGKHPAADQRQRALQALNRLTFGPRPGDVEQVMEMGVDKWIELQLHPEKIDDNALAARLEPLRTLRMGPRELAQDFPPAPLIKAVASGRQPMPADPQERAIYQAQLERYRQKQERQQAAEEPAGSDSTDSTGDEMRAQRREQRQNARADAEQIAALPPAQRLAAILRLPEEEQQMLLRSLPPQQRASLLDGLDARQRETVLALQNPAQVVTQELLAGRLLRDIYSQRQLQEVMTDFWLNHFNVFVGKGADHYLLTSYERDVVRPHALGKFKDLLVATAQSPAMLFYLDNWLSVGPDSDAARGIPPRRNPPLRPRARLGPFGPRIGVGMPFPPPPRPRRPRRPNKSRNSGLNENYARELMELHTLSVNGGYSQQDVIAVAKVFTGWTIQEPFRGGGFTFNPRLHQPGDKMVLGRRIKQGGEREGLKVLDMLARSPATAKFICTQLAQRFVSDSPPPALVARMQSTFLKKDGDMREVLRTLFRSPEFWAPEAYRAKVKTPLEFVVSAVRASGAEVNDPQPLLQVLNRMGEPLYGCQPPNGYPLTAETWVNSSALLNRMNFALALANGRLPGVEVGLQQLLGMPDVASDPHLVLAQLENHMLEGEVSPQTQAIILRQLDDPRVAQRRLDDPPRPPNVGILAGLLLGSPEFQRR